MELDKAKRYIFRLLKFRIRTESEITQRLRKKGFTEKIIEELIRYFKDANLINDSLFASQWLNERLNRGYGIERIKWELKQKGISEEYIQELIAKNEVLEKENDMLYKVMKEKIKKIDPNLESFKKKAILYRYLIQRGFSQSKVLGIIENYF